MQNIKFKKGIGTIFIPLMTIIILIITCHLNGVTMFASEGHWITFFRATTNVLLTTFALSINLNSGRFDFSLGSISLVSSIISSMVCIQLGLPTLMMLIISIVVGGVLGMISGMAYVILKIPAIIVSLGITLFYEGLAFTITNGYGVSFVSNKELISFPSIVNYALIIIVITMIIIILFDYTKFGYEYKALMTGQKVAVETGINEKKNAVLCYIISGILMGIVGFVNATNTGTIQMSLNFGTIVAMFIAFLPMFIGGFLSRYTNDKIGYLMGAISMAAISLVYARLNVDSSIQQIISAVLLVGFLIYLNNENKLKKLFQLKK